MSHLSEDALEAKRAYKREWYRKNKDRQKEYMRRYWEKKAREAQGDEAGRPNTEPSGD